MAWKFSGATPSFSTATNVASGAERRGSCVKSGWPESSTEFGDIPASKKKAVGWAVDTKVAEPQSDDNFGGTTECTHEEVLTYMYKAVVEAPKVQAENANKGIDLTMNSKEIQWAVEKKILIEEELKNFKADENCSRGDILTYLWRAAGSPKATGTSPFRDVEEGDSYYDAVIWAYNKEMLDLITTRNLYAGLYCNRPEVAYYLWKFAGSPTGSKVTNYDDVTAKSVSKYKKAVDWAVAKKVISPIAADQFGSVKKVTHSQFITCLYTIMK